MEQKQRFEEQLKKVQDRLEALRGKDKRRRRLSPEQWDGAAILARSHSINKVAGELLRTEETGEGKPKGLHAKGFNGSGD